MSSNTNTLVDFNLPPCSKLLIHSIHYETKLSSEKISDEKFRTRNFGKKTFGGKTFGENYEVYGIQNFVDFLILL